MPKEQAAACIASLAVAASRPYSRWARSHESTCTRVETASGRPQPSGAARWLVLHCNTATLLQLSNPPCHKVRGTWLKGGGSAPYFRARLKQEMCQTK